MSEKRQLATIMFTDIVGFTFLMGKDENHGLAILETNRSVHRECLDNNHGHFVKEIGDGMLSWFSDAADAIRCALAIQRSVQEHDYKLRIGLHLGDVVLRDGDVFGNTVNIANRVESIANPGGIFVTEQVVEYIPEIDDIQFVFLGETTLKNVESKMRIFGLEHPLLVKPVLNIYLEDSIEQDIQHYHLVEKLGIGGMGIIYKAFDTKLERYVALKFLSSQLNRDEKGRQRFIQEARAAAALQHPRICTIYEVDQTEEGRFFIAMELVPGPTLKEYLERESPLPPEQCIDLALQLGQGLEHAHKAGVVHRDIKLENIKITAEGKLKILDFGLALSGNQQKSRFGLRVGTLAYMSPEQTRGEQVDHRTDIWSFGVVLYRIMTGYLPFSTAQNPTLIHAILHEMPASVSTSRPDIPPGLADLTSWCLEKEAGLRVQTASDLVAALHRIRRDLSDPPNVDEARLSFFQRVNKGLVARPWLLLIMFLFILALGWGLNKWPVSSSNYSTPTVSTTMTPFTVWGGLSFRPVWSPDGNWIIYVSNEGGNMDLWKKPLVGGKAERITDSPDNEIDPAWSPDGRSIAFRSEGKSDGIFIIPSTGGANYQLTNFGSSPAWSPDSRQLAFSAHGSIYLIPAAGGDPQLLVEGTSANPRPVWTADGKRILFWHRTRGDIHVVDVEGGESKPLSLIPSGKEVSSIQINKAGDRLLFSMGFFGGNKNLYEVAIDTLTSMKLTGPRNLTITPTDDIEGAYSPNGRYVAFTARTIERHLYSLPIKAQTGMASGAPQKLTQHGKMNYYPELSANDRHLMWTSHRSGQGNLYSSVLGERTVEKVTSDWSPGIREISGRFDPLSDQVIFASTQGGSYQLWRVPSIGSIGLQLTETQHPVRDVHPSLSPNGASLAFYSNRSGTWDIWQLDLGNGNALQRLTDWPGNELYPTWSPDGRTMAFAADRNGNADIWTMAVEDTTTQLFIDGPADEIWCTWSPDQRWFYFVSDRDGNYNIWRTPGSGGNAKAVTSFNDPAFGLSENSIFTKFSAGQDQLILALESRKGDIYILNILEEE